MVFHLSIILSNRGSLICLEEPEVHAFPIYSQDLGERIVNDTENQYLITTHNPYFLDAILDKGNQKDIAVFQVYNQGYETKINKLTIEEIEKLRMGDIFFQLTHLRQ